MDRRREIYIKINKLSKLVEMLTEVHEREKQIRALFEQYDALSLEENNIFDNWGNYMEDTFVRMDHLRL